MNKRKPIKSISYAKWGYIFILPFFLVYAVFSFYPMVTTFYYSFFENYNQGLTTIGPNFVGLQNYVNLFKPNEGRFELLEYTKNTMIMWVLGVVPQFIFSLLLAVIFTSVRLKIKGQRFFKTVIYMPNLIMAAAYSMLFYVMFSEVGPVGMLCKALISPDFVVFQSVGASRGVIAFINFLMWFGNTTIMLMAGIMGIDQSLFEAASIDGANGRQVFFKITLPLLSPIFVYVAMTSLIGGLQMFDVPQIIGGTDGAPNRSTRTLIMWLNNVVTGKARDYGKGGAISVLIFIITGILSFIVYKSMVKEDPNAKKNKRRNKNVLL
ncbi:MAG: sugar ABC transporter permease [Oscillospiraceae bacterium]|nr:sugar ABC transporter permease [Oscillospiraceae bacterium]